MIYKVIHLKGLEIFPKLTIRFSDLLKDKGDCVLFTLLITIKVLNLMIRRVINSNFINKTIVHSLD